jgi:CubicO group peptidase (beta-lactamase class C family)
MDFPPGQVWKYNGGTTQLLAAIIEKTTGKKVDQFANENLFLPLELRGLNGQNTRNSSAAAASGLRLRSRDLLKFGLMYNQNGLWQGKQINRS